MILNIQALLGKFIDLSNKSANGNLDNYDKIIAPLAFPSIQSELEAWNKDFQLTERREIKMSQPLFQGKVIQYSNNL